MACEGGWLPVPLPCHRKTKWALPKETPTNTVVSDFAVRLPHPFPAPTEEAKSAA